MSVVVKEGQRTGKQKNGEALLLCSTKRNANLILACDFAELVALCKVIVGKTHIPVRTQKWPPRLIFQGHVTASKLVTETCDKTCGEHVNM